MKVSEDPVSAFSVYSEQLKQKKKPKKSGDLLKLSKNNKLGKKKSLNKSDEMKRTEQMNEIGSVLKALAEQSKAKASSPDLLKDISKILANGQSNEKNSVKPRKPKKNASKGKSNGIDSDTKVFDAEKEISLMLKKAKHNLQSPQKKINSLSPNRTVGALPERYEDKSVDINTNNHKDLLNSNNSLKRKKQSKSFVANSKEDITNVNPKKKTNMFEAKGKIIVLNGVKSKKSNELNHANKKKTSQKASKKKRNRVNNLKLSKQLNKDQTNNGSSIATSRSLFEWLILPIGQSDFMRDYWEQRPLLIKRAGGRDYYSELLSTPKIDSMLRENNIYFTKHLDVTSYTDGVRETHNLSGRAQANVVWDFYSNGCSVRLLNPQAFVPKIHELNAMLQEYFGCFVGANVYLTPPNSQGFAPHYDDIEAFVLQIEGKKHWKVYTPRNDGEILPRESSHNFTEEELGEPFLDVILEPGDMLYFPRGHIHQANTVEGEHSLHITLSAYQKTAWVDLLAKTLPIALKKAAMEDVEFRKGLPRDYLGLDYHGSATEKAQFMSTAAQLVSKLGYYMGLALGSGVDQMGAQFMHDALPPVFNPEEKINSGLGGGLKMEEGGELVNRVQIDMDSKVKLIRANICRMVEEEEEVRLYHCLDNPLEYHAEEPQFLVLPREGVLVITSLLQKYPHFTPVRSLPHDDQEELLTLVSDLWEAGILLAEGLQAVESEAEVSEGDEESD